MQLPSVITHLERFCGPIVCGWSLDLDGNKMPFQVVKTERGPISGTTTFATLGLSKYPLRSRSSQKTIRQELVMLSRSDVIPASLPALLQRLGIDAMEKNYAYLRGDVIGPRGHLFPSSTVTALYVSVPVYFPEEFSSVEDSAGAVIFAWLIPITNQEARLVDEVGWEGFEAKIEKEDPDLLDFGRASVVQY
jgi:Suppressor of fused protein (SUFU)